MLSSNTGTESVERKLSRQTHWTVRRGVWITGWSLLIPQLIGSGFNIAYNSVHIESLLNEEQLSRFFSTVTLFNFSFYPLAAALWFWVLWSLQRPYVKLLDGVSIPAEQLKKSQRMVINLPWWGMAFGAVGWFSCIPVFLGALSATSSVLDSRVYVLLPISFAISGLIATSHAFFLIEMLAQRLLYPTFFVNESPSDIAGARPLSLRSRGLLWVMSAGVCPIVSLLLLMIAPQDEVGFPWFGLSVGGIGVVFGLVTAWLGGRWIIEPVHQLRTAARSVGRGDLNTHLDILRADEFGPLIDEFNHMVTGLREKERVEETFGRHVGQQAAKIILGSDSGNGRQTENVTIMFVDIRNFTARCEKATPEEVVEILNLFLTEMVEVVESNLGMVNKFLGDGFMAIFGATDASSNAAELAVHAGSQMLKRLTTINKQLNAESREPLEIGIGIHSGPAIVGSIGSPKRMEFTVIGDTVNIASRVESLTKELGHPLLVTEATRQELSDKYECVELESQRVKGQSSPVAIWKVEESYQ